MTHAYEARETNYDAQDELRVEPSDAQTIAYLTAALEEQEGQAQHLVQSLHHARSIGIAVGIIMATQKVSEADAFRLLAERSQHLNRKVRDIAPYVRDTGSLPDL